MGEGRLAREFTHYSLREDIGRNPIKDVEGKAMTTSGPATSFDRSTADPQTRAGMRLGESFRAWIRGWYQVLIAELLHVLERRTSSRPLARLPNSRL